MTINAWTGSPDPAQQDAQASEPSPTACAVCGVTNEKHATYPMYSDHPFTTVQINAAPTPPAQPAQVVPPTVREAAAKNGHQWDAFGRLYDSLCARPITCREVAWRCYLAASHATPTPQAQRVTLTPDEIDLIDSGMCGEREFSHNYAHAIIEAYERKNAQPSASPTPPAHVATWDEYVETACALIKAADDAAADRDYMLDSDDCIKVLRGQWKAPLANDHPTRPQPAPAQQDTRRLPTLPFAVFDEFGKGCEDRIDDYFSAALAQQYAQASAHPGGQEELKQWQRDGSPMPSPEQAVPEAFARFCKTQRWSMETLENSHGNAPDKRIYADPRTRAAWNWEVSAHRRAATMPPAQRRAPIDWSQAGALMEAAASAKSAGFTTGTTNWAAHICRHMEAISARQKPSWTRLPADDTEGGAA